MKNLKKTASVKLYGTDWRVELTAKVGSYIEIDDRASGGVALDVCDDWAPADYRIRGVLGTHVAVNVYVTGRTIQTKSGSDMIRIAVEFVGDDEPSSFAKGWLYCQSADQSGNTQRFA